MLSEEQRHKIVDIMQQRMEINPEFVARDGATSIGYRTFVPTVRAVDGSRITRFVPWSHAQYEVIVEHKELFAAWFSEDMLN